MVGLSNDQLTSSDVEAFTKKVCAGQPKGFPDCDVNEIMVPDDAGDLGYPSDDDEVDEEEIATESGFECVIVVDGLPTVPKEKFGKLEAYVKKVYGQLGTIRSEGGFYMPVDNAEVSKGYAFIEFTEASDAQAAVEKTQGYEMDKKHKWQVCMFDDFDKLDKVPDEYEDPPPVEYKPVENLQEWLTDPRGRDEFVVRHGDETEVLWNDAARSQPEDVYKRSFWTESFVQWAPYGSLLATIHRQGIAVWGGSSFNRICRMSHQNVHLMEFSPNESYIISYSAEEPRGRQDRASLTLNVFDTFTGKKLRTFEGPVDEYAVGTAAGAGGAVNWPLFKWAGGSTDKFFARLGKNAISVYEAPEMGLLDKKSVKLDMVQDFTWSPADPILCAYQTEQGGGNLPARISLIRFPDRTELRQKNLFSVADVQMFWHPQGTYLAVQVDRFTKSKKTINTSFELFSLKERDTPAEVLELPAKTDRIHHFAWEPHGSRFAILHAEPAVTKPQLSVYDMRDVRNAVKGVSPVLTNPTRNANMICWSPAGKNMVLAGLKSMNGQLEFYNVDESETMATGEHFMCTDIEWDPTGRYVATVVTSVHEMENGFNVWSWNGHLLYRVMRDRFYQFSWRPRPPSLLSPEKVKEIARNLRKYSEKYAKEDESLMAQADTDLLSDRRARMDEWQAWLDSHREWREAQLKAREAIIAAKYPQANEPDTYTTEQEAVEEVVGHTEEVWHE
mmetsp:Transcript_10169/g.30552  ORF Transcript_10169/g.30552 Transcript_10169/m.30552 type:complete len:728 (-) Transcript_10169:256-2439(-)